MRDKVVSAAEAVAIIRPGDMVATSGFVGVGTPDAIFVALEERFLATGQPRDLGLLFAAAPGDGKEKGLNRLAHDGLIRRAVGGHWSLVPKLGKMAADGLIEAWNLPLGCVSQLFREIAGRRPGLLSRVGIGTFVDPRHGGGKLNAISAQRSRPGDGDRRAGMAVLPGHPGRRCDHSRHHRRPRRQYQHGARGADPGQPGDRDGGQGQQGLRDRPGRAPGGRRCPAGQAGRGAGRAGRLRRAGAGRASRPDLRHRLQPGLSRASCACRSTASRPWPWTSARSSPAAVRWSCRWAAWSISASACPRRWRRWPRRRTCCSR